MVMPILQAVHRELGNRVTFIGIDEKDTRQAATSFLRSVGVTYSNGFDPNGTVGLSFLLEGTPTTYFISKGRELDSRRARSPRQAFAPTYGNCLVCHESGQCQIGDRTGLPTTRTGFHPFETVRFGRRRRPQGGARVSAWAGGVSPSGGGRDAGRRVPPWFYR